MMARMARPLALVLLAPLAALALSACGHTDTNLPVSGASASSSSASPAAVIVVQFHSFAPSHVTIRAGQTVQWQWRTVPSPDPGNVTFAGFGSPTLITGTWSHTFSAPGSYPFRNTLSLNATGVVTVVS